MDGPLPRPRWSSEASGKPSAPGKDLSVLTESEVVEEGGQDFSFFLKEYFSQNESQSALWPLADAGSGTAPTMNSGSRSSSPAKVAEEGKVNSAVILDWNSVFQETCHFFSNTLSLPRPSPVCVFCSICTLSFVF